MDIIQHHDTKQASEFEQIHTPEQLKTATHLLALGTVSGLLLNWLVWDRIGGSLGMFLWTVFSCGAVIWLNRLQNKTWRIELLIWTTVIICAAWLSVLRDADQVMLLMYLVMLLSLGIVFYRARGDLLGSATLPRMFNTALHLPARIVLSIFPALDMFIKSSWKGGNQISAVFRGLMLAIPLLFVFVLLFASADAVFSQQLDRVGSFMSNLSPSAPLINLVLVIIATGVLSCGLIQHAQSTDLTTTHETQQLWPGLRVQLGKTETAIVMGSLALLFVTFVILQASYLFGGRELIEVRSGLTLADYARRGFFELLTVAALTMGVLIALASVQCHQRLFRQLGGVLIACVMIMLVSSVYRLNLYVEQFGLTMARLVALSIMLWLSISLLWFAATVLQGNARGFLAGLVISSMACCLLLAAINPAARVAQVNIEHARNSGSQLDIDYLNRLGADVVPFVIASGVNCFVTETRFSHWAATSASAYTSSDWREWNAARAAARDAVIAKIELCHP